MISDFTAKLMDGEVGELIPDDIQLFDEMERELGDDFIEACTGGFIEETSSSNNELVRCYASKGGDAKVGGVWRTLR